MPRAMSPAINEKRSDTHGKERGTRLGHESLDVTLAYLKGEDAESEEAQERANSSSLSVYA
jgi:hypothetical protein